MRAKTIEDVARYQLCNGCGTCAYMSPDEIEMIDVLDHGRRPRLKKGTAHDPRTDEAFRVCPGHALQHSFDRQEPSLQADLMDAWGPVIEVFEGHAVDAELRFAASSGGAATALALWCIERGGMHGVLHIRSRFDAPLLNETVLSRTRAQLLVATGSRYAPASPCDGLQQVEDAPAPCVMIGKPCDIAGARAAARLRPRLESRLGLTIAIFCAGTPSTRGTVEMLQRMGIPYPMRLRSLRYRGKGWPGDARAEADDGAGGTAEHRLTYQQSWGFLEKFRQWRCSLCVDHSGEFADIAVGDPWYRPVPPDEPGKSLIVVRTANGRRMLEQAVAAGYLAVTRRANWVLEASQPGFPESRGKIWGRLLALRVLGVPVPRHIGFAGFRFWCTKLSLREKLKSIAGTWRRVFRRSLHRPIALEPYDGTKR
jgi:coenzyme F420 hydrogenase subunit beta